jgi:hypothetical protein
MSRDAARNGRRGRPWVKSTEVVDMTGWEGFGWRALSRAGNFAGSATWWAQHSCGGPPVVMLGTQLRAGARKYCPACKPKPPGTVQLTGRLRPKRKTR